MNPRAIIGGAVCGALLLLGLLVALPILKWRRKSSHFLFGRETDVPAYTLPFNSKEMAHGFGVR